MKRIKVLTSSIVREQSGQALSIVLAMLALGGLVIAPVLDSMSTSLNAGTLVEKRLNGLYAADAGVEHGIWTLVKNEPPVFPHSYILTGINGMSVTVTLDRLTTLAGQDVSESGVHEGWMNIIKSVTYDAGIYSYTLSVENNGAGNMKVDKILIDLPPELEYVYFSTTGMITDEPQIVGTVDTGITLIWEFMPYTLGPHEIGNHFFQLSGPPNVEGVEGHSFVRATRDDVGTVWDADSKPFSILSQAKDSTNTVVATIKAVIWRGTAGYVDIAGWQLNP